MLIINLDKLIQTKLEDGEKNFFTSARQKHELFLQNITLVLNTLVKGRLSFCTTVTDIYLTTSGIILVQKSGNRG